MDIENRKHYKKIFEDDLDNLKEIDESNEERMAETMKALSGKDVLYR
ncbi:hypothetical protein SPSYN_01620 [Sporotomaculum syntrophicum]|uniref:Uncharacterized protein n=1 Tax=Sporotomaculum syntrophicum TaxID=182264 RepID=A0A9D2WQG6_9FIRM|nr:hypothetical protein [Sporotomaculum syntrophicum]KAF1085478.1 hypothetical protein SPSYN_01620 [Sporotomaculum syntrophicum]